MFKMQNLESALSGDDFTGVDSLPQDQYISGVAPLTNKAKLRAFCEQAAALGYPGAEEALRAIDYIVEGCSSPMESTLYCLMTLPVEEGGYGVPAPLAGYVINISADYQALLGERRLRCDLCWPDERVAIEYDSDGFHTGSPAPRRNPLRAVALGSCGYTVIPISRGKVLNLKSFDGVMRKLFKALDMTYRKPTEAELQKKRELRLEYFRA